MKKYRFDIREFEELEPEDYSSYWADHKLPHPGCPISFKLLIEGVIYLNQFHLQERTNHYGVSCGTPDFNIIRRKERAFRELATVVSCPSPLNFIRPPLSAEHIELFHDNQHWFRLYWSLKQKTLYVPIDFVTTPYQWIVEPLAIHLNKAIGLGQ